jgi:hypothetical protein
MRKYESGSNEVLAYLISIHAPQQPNPDEREYDIPEPNGLGRKNTVFGLIDAHR